MATRVVRGFKISIGEPYFNDCQMMMLSLRVEPTEELEKYMKLIKHKKFRIAKKNARKLANLIGAEFYKGENNKWTVEVNE